MGKRGLTEIHTHILPSVDDGASDIMEALAMLKEELRQGITRIIVTPHYYVKDYVQQQEDEPQILDLYQQLKQRAQEASIPIEIYLGNELYLSMGAIMAIQEKDVHSLAESKYYLIECAYEEPYQEMYQSMRQIIQMGVAPVMAHVERYSCLHNRIDRVSQLIDLGCYIQINAGTILKNAFSSDYRFAKKLLQQDKVHFISSDCHDIKRRPPLLQPCYEKCKKLLSEMQLERIFFTNPENLLQNKSIY